MKIALGIISMFLGLLVLLQSCTVGTASHMIGNQSAGNAGIIGMLAGVLYFIGGAFSFGLPIVATVVFALAAIVAFAAGASGEFSDLNFWGFIALALAVGSFFTWRSGRKSDRSKPNA